MSVSENAANLVQAVTQGENADVNPMFRANANMMRRELQKQLNESESETPNEIVLRVATSFDFELTEQDVLEAASVLEHAVHAAKENGLTLHDDNLWLSACLISRANTIARHY